MSTREDETGRVTDLLTFRLSKALQTFNLDALRQLVEEIEDQTRSAELAQGSPIRDYRVSIEKLRHDAADAAAICEAATDPFKKDIYRRLHEHMLQLADDVEQAMKNAIKHEAVQRQRLLADWDYALFCTDIRFAIVENALGAAGS
jgi:flagellar motility protein MotE (MotC chaperone)